LILLAPKPGRQNVLVLGIPKAEITGVIGFLALAANLASVLILARYKDGDANVRSVWLVRAMTRSGMSRS
jgi:hypothetical protein